MNWNLTPYDAMRKYWLLILPIIFLSCNTNKEILSKENNNSTFYVGTYTEGDSKGIYKYVLMGDGTLRKIGLVATTDNPTFLTMSYDKKHLLACQSNAKEKTSSIKSYRISEDSLLINNSSTTGGFRPCFISVNNLGYVLTANYHSGNIALHKLNSKGELSKLLYNQQHYGNSITDRQKEPHAHSVYFNPVSSEVVSVDLGTDELWFSNLDTVLQVLVPSEPYKISMAPGAGPRHLNFHPNNAWVYVINELNSTITMIQKNTKGIYEKLASVSTLPNDYIGENTCADIHISLDGRFLYASNRGHNSIAIFSINPDNGSLKFVALESVRGDWPRNFSLTPNNDFIVVSNQFSNNLVSFKRNKKTGLITYVDQIQAPTPVCILFD